MKVHEALQNKQESVNENPYGAGWMVEVEMDEGSEQAVSELLNAKQYKALIE